MNLFTYNEQQEWYEYFCKVNLQLSVYLVEVESNCVTVTQGSSPILQKSIENARENVVYNTKETCYGIEFIKMLNHAITNNNCAARN